MGRITEIHEKLAANRRAKENAMLTISVTPAHGVDPESFAVYRDHAPIGTIYISATIEYDVPVLQYIAWMDHSWSGDFPSFTAAMDAIANYTQED
jgi:hypothetical protein